MQFILGYLLAVTMGSAMAQRGLQADNYMIGISKKAGLIIHLFILLLISVSLFVSNLLHNCLRSLFFAQSLQQF